MLCDKRGGNRRVVGTCGGIYKKEFDRVRMARRTAYAEAEEKRASQLVSIEFMARLPL
jgi:hypothetical protein